MTKIKFGLRIPSFPVDNSDANEFIGQILAYLKQLEEDFNSAWLGDHFIPWTNIVDRTTPFLEGLTSVIYFSGLFQKLIFGNIVLCNFFRKPSLLAKMGATLQTLTRGRFVLGIGAGWKEDECIAYGYEFDSAKVRIEQLEEAVQIIKKMWTEGTTTFKGKYYCVDKADNYPKPNPIPPIMIGGTGEKLILRVIARHADWWNVPTISLDTFKHKLNVLREHCKDVGRNQNDIVITLGNNLVAIAKTEKQAWELAHKSPFFNKENELNYLIGTPDILKEKIEQYINLGVQHFIFRFADFPKTEGAKLFAQEIIPELT